MLKKIIFVFLVIMILKPLGAYSQSRGYAKLIFCEVATTSGEKIEGYMHIGTGYKYCTTQTNGLATIDFRGRVTVLPWGWGGTMGFEVGDIISWNALVSGCPPGRYTRVSSFDYSRENKFFFLKDISRVDTEYYHRNHAVTFDTTRSQKKMRYQYTEILTDDFILLDHVPLFTKLPRSYENGEFHGGTIEKVYFVDVESLSIHILDRIPKRWIKKYDDARRRCDDKIECLGYSIILNDTQLKSWKYRCKPKWTLSN